MLDVYWLRSGKCNQDFRPKSLKYFFEKGKNNPLSDFVHERKTWIPDTFILNSLKMA